MVPGRTALAAVGVFNAASALGLYRVMFNHKETMHGYLQSLLNARCAKIFNRLKVDLN